jgi:hypothetical protein
MTTYAVDYRELKGGRPQRQRPEEGHGGPAQ